MISTPIKLIHGLIILSCAYWLIQTANAKVDAETAENLGKNLTAMGATISANNAANIPAWTANTSVQNGEQPLFIITATNFEKHKEHLTAGQIALFKQYPDSFNMPIYKSHRTFKAPDWVYQNTKKNALTATLNATGSGFDHAIAGIPFPIPNTALEVYFNHIARWRGKQLNSRSSDANVFEKGAFTITTRETLIRYDYYLEDRNDKNRLFSLISKTTAPASKSGSGGLVLEPLDQLINKRSAWQWDKGRRRVIRAPNVAYDQPVNSSNALRTADDTDMINGSPDRFDWQLMEKKEIYIPYNNDNLADKSIKNKQLLTPFHINPAYARYELHRVWVIRATLKDKWRHVYSKRDFYLDEDSWSIVLADQYDKQGQLWRVSMAYLKQYSELPGTLPVISVFHDLQSRRYHVMGLQSQKGHENTFDGPIAKDNQFTPNALKRFVK